MPTLTIEVTADDIANGKQGEPSCCPIALALNRRIVATGYVHPEVVEWVGVPGAMSLYACSDLSIRAQRFVDAFDGDRPVKPFRFRLDVPDEVVGSSQPKGGA